MKFSEQWLRTWVDPDVSTDVLLDQLTMAGLEVDGIEPAGGEFTDVVVARVESIEKHPDADKLNVCSVNDGEQTLQIVCGASNVRPDLLVPLAKLGAVLPGKEPGETFKIKPAKLRGVESSGMLCSEKELGLADSADGLMELAADAPLGTSLREYLGLDDNIIEVDLTPNRGDCLSIAGIAREVSTINDCDPIAQSHETLTPTIEDSFDVNIEAEASCTNYAGRVVRNVDTAAQTPLWMVERLRRSGIRSLGAIVDITNYVMLELGQPMHAFDLARLDGAITVRNARAGEQITLLDGKEIECDDETLLITDASTTLALAGIMGGEDTGVTDSTKDVFLESAFFRPEIIAGKARSYGLHTDSSHRFERGVDTGLQVIAIERATELLVSICGGDVGPVTQVTTDHHPVSAQAIEVRRDRVKRLLGIDVEDAQIETMLERLGMSVGSTDAGWTVTAPSYRFDINIEADLMEEIVRLYGYNNVPRNKPVYHANMQAISELRLPPISIKQTLVDRGYLEAITYSFVEPELMNLLDPGIEQIALANPISSEMSVMRSSLLPGLLTALKHNLNRQQSRVRMFETGLCFMQGDELVQVDRIGGAVTGAVAPAQWGEEERPVDFFDVKADVEALLDLGGRPCEFRVAENPVLHPGQSADIICDGVNIGYVGALHPTLTKDLDIDQTVYVFQISLDDLRQAELPSFEALSRYPEVRRDLAIIVEESVQVADIRRSIQDVASELLRDINIFDIYTGKGIEPGRKSVALGLILQGFSSTLTDQEIDREVEQIVTTLKTEFTATLRE